MSTRVYVAAGAQGVRALAASGSLQAPTFAVPAAWRDRAGVDEEELEYDAACEAEDACRASGDHVVVVAADVAAVQVTDTGAVDPAPVVAAHAIVSFHVAEHGAPAEEELLWYDATEMDEVLAYLDSDA